MRTANRKADLPPGRVPDDPHRHPRWGAHRRAVPRDGQARRFRRRRDDAGHHPPGHPVPPGLQVRPPALIRTLNDSLVSTLAACGDVVRNTTACPAPLPDGHRAELAEWAQRISEHFKPRTQAYYQIWIDGERAVSAETARRRARRNARRRAALWTGVPAPQVQDRHLSPWRQLRRRAHQRPRHRAHGRRPTAGCGRSRCSSAVVSARPTPSPPPTRAWRHRSRPSHLLS